MLTFYVKPVDFFSWSLYYLWRKMIVSKLLAQKQNKKQPKNQNSSKSFKNTKIEACCLSPQKFRNK